jgi:hypothetical protein
MRYLRIYSRTVFGNRICGTPVNTEHWKQMLASLSLHAIFVSSKTFSPGLCHNPATVGQLTITITKKQIPSLEANYLSASS